MQFCSLAAPHACARPLHYRPDRVLVDRENQVKPSRVRAQSVGAQSGEGQSAKGRGERAFAEIARGLHGKPVVPDAADAVGAGETITQPQVARQVHSELGVQHDFGGTSGGLCGFKKGESQGLSTVA